MSVLVGHNAVVNFFKLGLSVLETRVRQIRQSVKLRLALYTTRWPLAKCSFNELGS